MTVATITPFENTVRTTNEWLDQLCSDLGRDDHQQAYRILRAVLMAVRDRLTVEEATDLGGQLPMLVRGLYFEGYNPSKTPARERDLDAFLAHVAENLQEGVDGDPEQDTRAVFRLLDRHVTAGQISHVKTMMPEEVRALWP